MKLSHSAVQWLHIVQERRTHDRVSEGSAPRLPEKEFLLIKATSINTNSEGIHIDGRTSDELKGWLGKSYLVTLDLRDDHHLTPRMKFNLLPWDQHTRGPP